MTRDPLYTIVASQAGWEVLPQADSERGQWRVRFATRQEALELADHLEYEPGDSPIGKPDRYERVLDESDIPIYRHTRKF